MRYLTKKKIAISHAIVLFSIISTNVNAQQVVLTFTGRDSVNHYVQLNRVAITNLTKSWQETIIWPDTVLIMQNGTGIEDYIENGGFSLSQNNPNPFSRTTDVSLTTCEERLTQIEISDVNGHVVEKFDFSPQPGIHQFRVTLAAAGTYIMTARQNGQTSSIKMVCYGGGGTNVIDYLGMVQTITFVLKSTTTNPFNFGDMMEYVGYATINGNEVESQRILQAQGASQTFVLQFDVSQNQLPALTTHAVNNITTSSATVGGTVTADGGATVFDRGVCYSTTQMPTVSDNCVHIGQGTGLFSDNLTGLTANTTYYVRAYAMNSVGTAYGNEVLFTTTMAVQLPTVITTTVSNITETTAFSGGNVTFDGGATVTARGVCWSTSHNPTVNDSHTTDGSGTGVFTSNITGLAAGTTYYVRAYATNSAGMAYGDEMSFTTAQVPFSCGTSTLSDIDGNMYNTVQIGTQCWMKENLRTTHYSDNTAISHGVSLSSDVPYYYYPDSSYYNVSTYGLLYNWKAVMHSSSSSTINPSGVQGICPNGWHVPSEAEWVQLTDYVSSQSQYVCGSNSSNIAKALANNTGWESSTTTCAVGNTQSNNNATGFSAMPAGGYFANGTQGSFGVRAYFWSTTENTNTRSYRLRISSMYSNISHGDNEKTGGLSVRCLKNNDGSTIQLPTVTTTVVSNITGTTAIGGGNVTSDGGVTVTTRGVCWSTSHNPTMNDSHTTDGSGMGGFTSNITGLTASTTYYVRAYAINSAGTAYGDEVSFTTVTSSVGNDGQPCQGTPTLTDIDGNVYNTVQIGNQCWMKENLRTTRYANGASIPIGDQYSNSDPYYYNYSSSPIPLEQRGYPYNWFAVMHGANSSDANPSGVQGVCPTGWHVPSSAEWSQLTDYVQGQSQYLCSSGNHTYIAKALASQTSWNSSTYDICDPGYNPSTNNATGFSAVPAGGLDSDGFGGTGELTYFWSSTSMGGEYWWTASVIGLAYIADPYAWNGNLFFTGGKGNGNSVRCLRNDGGGSSQSLPSVSTCAVSNILANTATSGVNVISDGGATVTECGVCWSTTHNPTTSQSHTIDGCGLGSFTSIITGLSANTTYYVRAYATNSIGTAYGNEVSFTTTIQGAIIILEAHYVWGDGSGYQLLLDADATAYGTVIPTTGPLTSSGNADAATYATFEHKIPQNADGSTYTTNVVIDGSDTIVIPAGVYDFCITNPTPGDRIWIAGSEYGRQDNFTFQINQIYHFYVDMGVGGDVVTMQPSVTTNAVSNVTSTTATFGGTVTSEGGSEVGIRGVCWSTSHNPTLSNSHTTINDYGIGSFSSNITGLTAGTTYYVRAYATNSVGTAYGNEVSFTTINNTTQLPTVTTSSVSNVTETSATCGGNVTSNGGANVTARGVCWSTSHNPTTSNSHTINGSDTGSFTSNITGLTAGTTYYVRAYATNSVGTAYGNEVSFTINSSIVQDGQPCPGAATVTDVDNNTYNTVQIGSQCWMKENLRTTRYADGTFISQGNSMSATVPYWYYPNGANSNMLTYGLLYNWKAVMRDATSSSANPSGVQGICPTGWHVPSNAEMAQLTNYVSSQSQYVCGSDSTQIAKALASTTCWNSNTNTCAVGNVQTDNNASGLSLTPAGCYWGVFGYLGSQSLLWTTTENSEDSENRADFWKASYNKAIINHSNDTKPHGYSVRCLRDDNGSSTAQLPTVTTSSVSNVTATSATGGGNITSDGGANVTARGVCWSTSHNPTTSNSHTINGSGTGNFTSNITGLTAGTTYYVRAYATNNVGTAYGNEVSFTTQTSLTQFTCGTSTLTDIDGNVYNTVEIGNQCWMKENLRTTKYADGTLVSQGNSSSSTTAYWYYPNGDASNMSTHGLLYNGTAIKGTSSNGAQGICPTGWHVPSDAEWTQLSDYMSSQIEYVCGSDNNHIAKALASTIGWDSNYIPCSIGNTPANNNVTGFNALSAGSGSSNIGFGYYSGYGTYAAFGSSSSYFQTEIGDRIVIYYLKTDSSNIYKRKEPYYYAHSVRCVSNRVVVNTNTTGSVTASTLTCGGYVSDDGGENVTARGVCWSLSHNPIISGNHTTDGSGTGYFISSLSGLTAGTTYYVRAYAINSMGTVYGDEHAFTTTAVTSKMVSDITETSATCGGVVTNGASVISRGICWGTSHNPSLNDNHSADGSGTGIFNSTLTGLTPGMTYYVRAYAVSNVDTLYGNEICFTTLQYCENITVNDVDGCEYHTVQIGDQCWMKENMRTTRYADGTAVELGSESEYSWSIAYRYHPNNDENNVAIYGYLYNWKAAMHDSPTSSSNPSGVQGICPDGWHVPSDAEWTQLSHYVGSNSQYVCGSDSTYFAKALASTTGWNSSNNICAVGNYSNNNNATRFSAFPAGDRNTFTYTNFGKKSIFWTTNTYNHTDGAYNNSISYDHASMSHNMEYSWNGYSVRCLRHNKIAPTLPTVTTSIVGNVSPISARGMGNVTNDGGADIISRGVCWSTSCNPTTDDSHTSENGGTGSFTSSITGLTPNTTYYVRAYAINSAGTAYGNVRYFTTTTITAWDGNACPQHSQLEDIDGHTYNTVQIGEQCWMKENLRTTKYADGTAIPYGSDYSETDAYWYYPNGNNVITYGLLYNRKAATRDAFTSYVQGVCPYGWHVPSEAERAQLYNYVNNYYACVSKALSSTLGWNYSTTSCHPGNSSSFNDASGFSALPAGDNSPNSAGNCARFWTVSGTWMIPTSSSTPGSEKASVRCLRDADTTPIVITHELHDISATTAVGVGNIAYNGGAPVVECGFCWSTSHNPTLANSHKVGNMSDSDFTCLLQELVLNTTYYVRAYATNSIGTAYGNEVSFTTIAHYDAKPCPNITTVTDADGNVYNTIQIGSQCWMKENLKAKHYTDGTFISPRYSPDDNSANIATYGYLYGWDAVMHNTASSNANPSSVQGVCPNGWHLPSEAEWTQLSNYLVGHNHYWCNEISSNVAKSLAGNSLWSTVNNNFDCCSPGCNQSTNNITGFSAHPAGYRGQISFDGLGNSAKFWSSTEGYANFVAYRYGIDYNTATVNLNSGNKADGCSVRCLHDGGGVITTNIPIINTSVVSDIYGRTATCGGDVSDDDGTSITARGVCWSTSQNPTTIDGHTTDGVGSGSFTSNITGLTPNTTYYVRAYATNNVWTVYGNEVSFTTPLAQGPSVITAEASNISPNTANCGGDVTYDGGANVIARGICWSISHNPTLNDNHTADGNGSGSFTNNLTGLSPNTTYYVRAYATNRVKTEYGGEVSFTTPAIQLPTVSTATVSSTIGTTAICGGNVISDGGATVTNRGICWSTEHNPTIANNHTSDGNGTGYFTSNLTGLTYSTTYYVRAYATNITGTSYGEEVFFTTSSLPTVITSPISNVLSTSATCGGNVISDGGETVTDRGVCWGISNNPTLADSHTVDGSGTGDFASVLTELTGGTTYFVRAYATNTVGTAYGIMETFTTAPGVPIVTTESISNITATSASCDGNVTFDGGSTVIARGFCWNTSNNPVIADSHTADGLGTGEFSSNITGLIPATTYYVRAYATNSIGSSYGTEITFATAGSPPCPNMPTILDADSNIYNTAFIGGVCWMRENLKTTKYADGTSLSQGTTTSTNIGYWYYPDNNSSNKETYGLLYNWKAVMRDFPSSEASPSGVQGICPNGWHVPSRLEWEQLINCFNSQSMYFCGGTSSNIAKALASTTGWQGSTGTCCVGNNQSSNNTTGFGMLPAGNYGAPSGNSSFGFASDYYSCTTLSDGRAIGPYLSNNLSDVRFGGSNKTIAQSVRCVRDY